MKLNNAEQSGNVKEGLGMGFFDVLSLLLHYKKLIACFLIAGLIIGWGSALLNYKTLYQSTGIIMIGTSTIAEGVGETISLSPTYSTKDIIAQSYKSIIFSNDNLRDILKKKISYELNKSKITSTVLDFFHRHNGGRDESETLRSAITTDFDRQNYLLTISVATANPEVSKKIADIVIENLNNFYNNSLRLQTAERANNLEKGLEQSRTGLERVRETLYKLRKTNILLTDQELRKNKAVPPILLLREKKLCEEEDEYLSTYKILKSKYDRLTVASSNIIFGSMIQKPEIVTAPLSKKLVSKTLPGAVIGLFLAGVAIFLMEAFKGYKNR